MPFEQSSCLINVIGNQQSLIDILDLNKAIGTPMMSSVLVEQKAVNEEKIKKNPQNKIRTSNITWTFDNGNLLSRWEPCLLTVHQQ